MDLDMNDLRRARKFAEHEKGDPYVFATHGPKSYDCSGLQGVLCNVLMGKQNPHQRLFGTGNMATVLPGLGFKKGVGDAHDFVLGWSTAKELGQAVGHTAGSLGGLNVESRGGKGVLVGAAARSPTMKLFKHQMHLPISGRMEDPLPPKPRPFGGKLKRGDKGPAVRLIQEALKVGGAPLQGTGTFGPKTEAHVKLFQMHRKLPGTRGIVHKSTWDRLMMFLGPPTTMMVTVGPAGQKLKMRPLAKRLAKRFFKDDSPAAVRVMEKQLRILNPQKAMGPMDIVMGGTRLKVPTTRP